MFVAAIRAPERTIAGVVPSERRYVPEPGSHDQVGLA